MSRPVPDEFEAVLFDIGGVIVNLPSIRAGYAAYLQEFAAEHDLDPAWAIDTWRERLGEHFRAADGTEYRTASEGYAKAFDALVDGEVTEDDWRPEFEAATREAMETEPNVVETIRALDEAGYYLGIVSDIDTEEAHRMLETFDLNDAFDGITTSEAVGYKKPDRRMFETAIETGGLDPTRTLYVGDRYDHDMEGGSRVGLWTVAYGGTAAESVEDAERDGLRIRGDGPVDFLIEDHRDLLSVLDLQ